MKNINKRLPVIFETLFLFFFNILAVSTTILIYSLVSSHENINLPLVIVLIILILGIFCTICNLIKRHFTIDRPNREILDATERITLGDFSVRFPKPDSLSYDEYSDIKENINRMAIALAQNELLKSDFISSVSHEIKTPLSIIQNYTESLKDDSLSKEKRDEYINIITTTTKNLSDMVQNILKLNKLENQEINPQLQEVKLNDCITKTILQYELVFDQKNIELECDIDEVNMYTDPSYIEIIIGNLLSNAVKFTPEGGNVFISLKKKQNDVSLIVRDNGCGMSEEVMKHIFDKFYQGDSSRTQTGNGLGLALVKKAVDLLHGEIMVESNINEGSTFKLTLSNN